MRPASWSRALGLSVFLSATAAVAQPAAPPPAPWPALPPPPAPTAPATPPPGLPPPPPAAPPPPSATSPSLPGTASLWAEAQGPRRSGGALTRERLRLLNSALIPLAERSRASRRSEGVLNLLMGAGIIGLGVLLQPSDAAGPSPFSSLLYFQGGWAAGGGLMQLAWAPARERLGDEFRAMPTRTAADRRARLHFGEAALDEMARDGSRRRVLSALAGVGLGLGTLGIIYSDQIFNGAPWPEPPEINYLVVGLTSISLVTNLIGVFGRSEEERLRDSYRRELQLLRDSIENPD